MQSEEILVELVEQTQEVGEFFGLTFEQGEEYWALADGRLSAFSSEQMWAVVFEIVGYDAKSEEYVSQVFLLGNCVEPRENVYLPNVTRVLVETPDPWNKEIEKNQIWGIGREQFALLYRGKRHDFAPTLEDLGQAGIELSQREIASGELSPQQMLRYLCEEWDHPFFLSEDALRDLLDENSIAFEWKYNKQTERNWYENTIGEFGYPPLPGLALELIVQTRDWTHPRIGDAHFDEGEWEVSPQQAFEVLAQTLAARDTNVWHAQDGAKFNSHWRNWAEIEADKERAENQQIAVAKADIRASSLKIGPLAARIAWLQQTRATLQHPPQVLWHIGAGVGLPTLPPSRTSLELIEEIDLMLAELQNA